MTETQAIELFKKKMPGIFFKLHGNMFQSSLPDIIWINEGVTKFLEFKIVSGLTLGWAKCRLAQHLTMMKMLGAGADVSYCVFSKTKGRFYRVPVTEVHEGQGTSMLDTWSY